jgi:hypothetical protein
LRLELAGALDEQPERVECLAHEGDDGAVAEQPPLSDIEEKRTERIDLRGDALTHLPAPVIG